MNHHSLVGVCVWRCLVLCFRLLLLLQIGDYRFELGLSRDGIDY